MKAKACCIGTPQRVIDALSGSEFARRFLLEVIGKCLGVQDVLHRPAEYYIQKADEGPSPEHDTMGVEVRLTGVSREGRTPKQFHEALAKMVDVVSDTILPNLNPHDSCQVFCVIMIDSDVETYPGSGKYTSNLEAKPDWVRARVA